MTHNSSPSAQALLEHADWMRGLARRLVHDDGDDLVQETWLAALQRPRNTDGALGAWLGSVLRNKASNEKRSKSRRTFRERAVAAREASVPSPAELVERSELHRTLVDAVLALRDPIRSTVLLRYFEGLTAPEIAARTNTPVATVRTRIHRGVGSLREVLDEQNGGEREKWVGALTPLFAPMLSPSKGALVTRTSAVASASGVSASGASVFGATTFKVLALALPLLALFGWYRHSGESFGKPHVTATSEGPARVPASQNGLAPLSAVEGVPDDGARARRSAAAAPDVAEASPATDVAREIRVADALTGEPAWNFALETSETLLTMDERIALQNRGLVMPPTNGEILITNKDGVVTVPAGTAGLIPIDYRMHAMTAPSQMGRISKPDPVALPAEDGVLRVDFGRHILLDVERPAGVSIDDLYCELRTNGEIRGAARVATAVRSFRGQAFVRIPERSARDLAGACLHVLTRDGCLGAEVEAEPYVATGRVASVVLGPRSSLSVELTAGDSANGAQFHLDLVQPESTTAEGVLKRRKRVAITRGKYLGRSSKTARFEYFGLAAGTYELNVTRPVRRPASQRVVLTPGATRHLKITMERLPVPEAGSKIYAQITSETGTFHHRLRCTAWAVSGDFSGTASATDDVEWAERDGVWTGTLVLGDVAATEYRLQLNDLDAHDGAAPATLLLEEEDLRVTPGKVNEIRLLDSRAFSCRTIRAIDDQTGVTLEEFDVALSIVNDTQDGLDFSQRKQVFDGQAVFPFLRNLDRIRGLVSADDYLPANLEEGCLVDGDLVVRLRRGWVGYFAALDEDQNMLTGIRVFVDGVDVGVTGAAGPLVIERDSPPDIATFASEGWIVTSAPFTDAEGRILAGSRESSSCYFATLRRK